MPKVTIEIEDSLLTSKVKFTMSPSGETLVAKNTSGNGLSNAEFMGIKTFNIMRWLSSTKGDMACPHCLKPISAKDLKERFANRGIIR